MEETIKITENDIQLLRSIIDIDANVLKCKQYIKEQYNIDSEFIPETLTIKLSCSNINESLNMIAARDYIYELMTHECIQVEL